MLVTARAQSRVNSILKITDCINSFLSQTFIYRTHMESQNLFQYVRNLCIDNIA